LRRGCAARLKLAQILVEHQRGRRYALRVLDELGEYVGAASTSSFVRHWQRKARQMIDDGVLELQGAPGRFARGI